MTKLKNKLLTILFLIFSVLCCCFAFGLMGCTTRSIEGTYYLYVGNNPIKSDYYILEKNTWENASGAGGRYEVKNDEIIFYSDVFGNEVRWQTGTIENGKLTVPGWDGPRIYYKEGSEPVDNGETKYPEGNNDEVDNSSTQGSENADKNDTTAKILNVADASIEDDQILMIVSPSIEKVSLASKITCSANCSWRLYYDDIGRQEIPTKIAANSSGFLLNGDNEFYIFVTSINGAQVNKYKLIIHRQFYVSVCYYDNMNSLIKTEKALTWTKFSASYIPEIRGYNFNYWQLKNNIKYEPDFIFKSIDLYANATAKTYNLTLNVNEGDPLTITEQIVTYNNSYNLPKPTKEGYSFLGWGYENSDELLTDNNGASIKNWTGISDSTLYAKWEINQYKVTLLRDLESGGTVTGAGTYTYKTLCSITANTNNGYTFAGWYKGDALVSMTLSYQFVIGASDEIFMAKWIKYPVSLEVDNQLAGTVSSDKQTKTVLGDKTTITAQTNIGYTFAGWYKNEEIVSKDPIYFFSLEETSVTYVAKWIVNEEMKNFVFASTQSECEIVYVKDNTVDEVVVPNYVTAIAEKAFDTCTRLTSITLPFVGNGSDKNHFGYIFGASSNVYNYSDYVPVSLKTVKITGGDTIGNYAFYKCTNLKEITIPDSVTSIGYQAFLGCESLEEITIGDSVTSIGEGAFYGCTRLTSITLPFIGNGSNENHFGYIFGARYPSYNLNYVPVSLKTVKITGGDTIGERAFEGCESLEEITIPDSVTSIGYRAFYECTSLKGVYINDIASWCNIDFKDNFSANPLSLAGNLYLKGQLVTNLEIPDSVTSIGYQAFLGCESLEEITIGDSVTSIGVGAFKDCTNLKEIIIGDSVTSIGYDAFYGTAYYNADTKWKNDVLYIGNYLIAAKDTLSGSYQIVPDTKLIANSAFASCYYLTEITIPESITSIGESAFYKCTRLTEITIPDSITSINDSAFEGCESLEEITIPDSVTSIGESAFCYCTNIKKATMPILAIKYIHKKNLKTVIFTSGDTINDSAFEDCESLEEITIPDSVTSIGYRAFLNCTNLKEIIIGDSVTSIGYGAFYGTAYYNADTKWKNDVLYIGNYLIAAKDTLSGSYQIVPDTKLIANSAFASCYYLTEITIPESITSIGESAFYKCTRLTEITIPDSVTSIGESAFEGCARLNEIIIPDSVTSIGYDAFSGCTNIITARMPTLAIKYIPKNNLQTVILTSGDSIGESAFYKCTRLTEITIPERVTSIGADAFGGCKNLKEITITDTVTSIGGSAFEGCTSLERVYINDIVAWCNIDFEGSSANPLYYAHNLYLKGQPVTNLEIPNGVTSIKNYAFCGFGGANLNIPEKIISIGERAFYKCTSIMGITIPDSVTSIGKGAFEGCARLTEITIDNNSVTSIGESAFKDCTSIMGITIPDSVTSIGKGAFEGCTRLISITLPFVGNGSDKNHFGYIFGAYYYNSSDNYVPESLKTVKITSGDTIGEGAFYFCTSLTEIIIPDSVTSIGGSAFEGCTSLEGITIPDNVTSIGKGAFEGCTSLIEITIPDNVTSINDSAFSHCTSLREIIIPDSVTSIGYGAFTGCGSLTEIIIPDSVTSIGSYAFHFCTSLTEIIIPDSVTYIGSVAFRDCTSLKEITIPNSVTSIGYQAFYYCTSLEEITIGNGVTSIGESAFYYCTSLEEITIGNGVTSIGESAFKGCTSLERVIFENTEGWKVSLSYDMSNPQKVNVEDSGQNVWYFKYEFCDYYWKRT